jgi:hypothetical protein
VRGSLKPRPTLKTDQARLLQSTWWPSYFRARHELARRALTGTTGATYFSCHALVNDARCVRGICGRELEMGLLDAVCCTFLIGDLPRVICLDRAIRFLLRWPKDYKLRDAEAQQT